MDERRDQPPDHVTRPALIVAGGRLSPLQEAWSRYVDHTTGCDGCRSIDSGRCEESERLWRAYRAQGDETYRKLSGETT